MSSGAGEQDEAYADLVYCVRGSFNQARSSCRTKSA
ncbi:hypothetical protein ACVWW6_008850 [Bradyrhizobium sp. USDA 3311]